MRLIAKLRKSPEQKKIAEEFPREQPFLSNKQVMANYLAATDHSESCANAIRVVLGIAAEVTVPKGMNFLIIEIPDAKRVEIEQQILSTCADVYSIVPETELFSKFASRRFPDPPASR